MQPLIQRSLMKSLRLIGPPRTYIVAVYADRAEGVYVRFGSKADMTVMSPRCPLYLHSGHCGHANRDVCFVPIADNETNSRETAGAVSRAQPRLSVDQCTGGSVAGFGLFRHFGWPNPLGL